MIKNIIFGLIFFVMLSFYFRKKNKSLMKSIITILFVLFSYSSLYSKSVQINQKIYLYNSSTFSQYASLAQEEMRTGGIYASLTLAQAAKEQGLKAPGNGSNNYFGIKANCGWTGPTVNSKTGEYYDGSYTTIKANFRAYGSVAESFRDHTIWLRTCYANRSTLLSANTLEGQLKSLGKYATSPTYVCSLVDIINNYDLTKYDVGNSYGNLKVEHKQIDPSDVGCGATDELEIDEEEYEEGEHYSTSYEGEILEGWLYNRLKSTEEYKDFDIATDESNIDGVIDEIFDRAKKSYNAYVDKYGDELVGPGLSAASPDGFKQRISMPTINGEGSQFYFTNANLSYAGGYLGQCTWYAFGRANEILNTANSSFRWSIASNAGLWYYQNLANGAAGFKSSNDYTKPKVGAIISWEVSGAPGHVAVVEAVNGNNITISEANISGVKNSSNPYGWQSITISLSEVNRRWGNYRFSGYIYLLN